MALLRVLCWALIFILRLRFPPGSSIASINVFFLINILFSRLTLIIFINKRKLNQRQSCLLAFLAHIALTTILKRMTGNLIL